MNPTTHPHLFERLPVGAIRQAGDLWSFSNNWQETHNVGVEIFDTTAPMYRLRKQTTMKPVIINVGKSEALLDAVLAAVASVGVKDPYNVRVSLRMHQTTGPGAYVHVNARAGLEHSDRACLDVTEYNNAPVFNAATEFGAFLDFIASPKEVRIKLADYEAVVTNGGVQVGCQFAAKSEVEKIHTALTAKAASVVGTPLYVRVAKNVTLGNIVVGLAKAAGFSTDIVVKYLDTAAELRFEKGDSGFWGGNGSTSYKSEGFEGKHFDARTEFGALVEYLEGSKTNTVTVNLTDGPTEVTIKDGVATLRGTTITQAQVEEIWKALQ